MYSEFGNGGMAAFVQGGSRVVASGVGISEQFAATLLTVMAVLFAGTTMDAGVRLQRYIVQEAGTIYRIPVLQNGYVATGFAVACCLLLAFGAGGPSGEGGMTIWPLFGTTNQLLAGLTLMVISVMLVKLGRPVRYTLVPMVFITVAALAAALVQLGSLYREGGIFYFLLWIDVGIVLLAILVMLEASSAFMRERRIAAAGASA